MKTVHTALTFTFDESMVSEQQIHDRLDAILQDAFIDVSELHIHWETDLTDSPGPDSEIETKTPIEHAFGRITRLSESLMKVDGLSAMLMVYIEEAPTCRESQAGVLAEEIRGELRNLGVIEDEEETVRSQLASLIDALEGIAGEAT